MNSTRSDWMACADRGIDPQTTSLFRSAVIEWHRNHKPSFPWRTTNNRWHALVAEIMLQRTRAEQVIPVFLAFCQRYPTPSDLLDDTASNVFSSLGLVWRQDSLRRLSAIVADSGIPSDREGLLRLPGVGPYIASAFRSFHLGIRDCIIDSNVVRLYGRYFGFETDGETRRKKWLRCLADSLTPDDAFQEYNYGLLDLTRAICRVKPHCGVCTPASTCVFYRQLTGRRTRGGAS